MPLYEYTCDECGKRFELLVREGTVPACPACRGTRVQKQLSAFAVGSAPFRAAAPPSNPACASCPHAGRPGGCGAE